MNLSGLNLLIFCTQLNCNQFLRTTIAFSGCYMMTANFCHIHQEVVRRYLLLVIFDFCSECTFHFYPLYWKLVQNWFIFLCHFWPPTKKRNY